MLLLLLAVNSASLDSVKRVSNRTMTQRVKTVSLLTERALRASHGASECGKVLIGILLINVQAGTTKTIIFIGRNPLLQSQDLDNGNIIVKRHVPFSLRALMMLLVG